MSSVPHVLLLFLDGVGVGSRNAEINPFFSAKLDTLRELCGGSLPHLRNARRSGTQATLVPVNATLGIRGLPQSGTGQTSLMTGINAAREIGRHFGPYPFSSQRSVIAERNVFRQLAGLGRRVFYANAFPHQFFEHVRLHPSRVSAITMSWMASGFRLNDHGDLASGKALSADLTGERWKSLGYPGMPAVSVEAAGRALVEFARQYDFVMFEYFLTDHAGHHQSMNEAQCVLRALDGLLSGVVDSLDHEGMLVLLTSDHGNLEDLSTKSHTRNPVPLLCIGAGHRKVSERIKSLTNITPAIVELFR